MVDFLKKRLQVFVSSTFSDLKEERQAAVEAILSAGHIPAGMELFAAGDESQMEVIRQWIDESDAYLLILGGRYGSVEPKTGKSYTQLEYEYAIETPEALFRVCHQGPFTRSTCQNPGSERDRDGESATAEDVARRGADADGGVLGRLEGH